MTYWDMRYGQVFPEDHALFGQHGIFRLRDIEAIRLPREYLVRLHRQGKLNRPGRGIYTLPDASVTERRSYAEVAKRVAYRRSSQPKRERVRRLNFRES